MSNQTKIVREKTFETIRTAVNNLVDMVRPTFGPASNKVIISKIPYAMVVDDGVQIARDYEAEDPVENAIVKLVREVAIKTNDRVGDGTTGSLIILQALINEIARKSKIDGRKIELELKRGLEEFKEQLQKSVKPISTEEELKKVAMVSFDDEKIAEMIAGLYFKLGKDTTITINKSPTMDTYAEMTEGVKINTGYVSQYMINNPQRMETVIEKPYILITDYRLLEANDLLPILNKMAKENKRELVLICDNLEQHALSTAVVNILQQKFFTVAIPAPQGEDKKVFLEDLALMTGAKMFTESKGDKLELAELADLGRAERFICRQDESIIVEPKGTMDEAIESLKSAIKDEQKESNRKKLEKRLAMYTNTLAVIKVGAPTENEQKALKYKIEDAVNSTKSAYKNGVVCGAGLALRIQTSSPLLNEALEYPSRQLAENAGVELKTDFEVDEAMNMVTGEVGNFMDVGVVDPVDVLLAGVESAVSIASVLVTSTGMIVEHQPPVQE